MSSTGEFVAKRSYTKRTRTLQRQERGNEVAHGQREEPGRATDSENGTRRKDETNSQAR